jgi:hypothetical protein
MVSTVSALRGGRTRITVERAGIASVFRGVVVLGGGARRFRFTRVVVLNPNC